MTALDRDSVIAAENAWILTGPPGTEEIETAEYKLVRLPYGAPDLLQLLWVRTERPAGDVLTEVLDQASGMGEDALFVYAKLDAPAGFDDALTVRGAELVETCDVLAAPLPTDAKAPDLPALKIEWRISVETARAVAEIGVEVFGGALPTGDTLEEALVQRAAAGRESVAAGTGGTVLARLDGTPVGTASLEIVDGVARLAGGGVLEPYRGKGIYRAMVETRLTYAADHGATMAFSFGRIDTSSPILRRLGFESYGQERMYRLPLG